MTDVVLLVPGFAASHLWRWDEFGRPAKKLWLSDLRIAWGGIQHLANNDSGNPINPEVVTASSVLEEIYQPFMRLLSLHGVEYHQWPYDWRGSVVSNGLRLLADLQQYRHSKKRVNIVGHSMGGLVAALALQNMDDELARSFPRFVSLGTPWHGSYQAVNLLTGQHESSQLVARWYQFGTFHSYRYWREIWGQVAATWPGAFDMLPSAQMLLADQVQPDRNPREPAWWLSVNPEVTAPRLQAALGNTIRGGTFPAGIQHYNWRGVGGVTPGTMPTKLPDGVLTAPRELLGDGTVPEFSSVAPAGFNSINSNFLADHAQFANDVLVQMALRELIGF